jgi:hypothetical protein
VQLVRPASVKRQKALDGVPLLVRQMKQNIGHAAIPTKGRTISLPFEVFLLEQRVPNQRERQPHELSAR